MRARLDERIDETSSDQWVEVTGIGGLSPFGNFTRASRGQAVSWPRFQDDFEVVGRNKCLVQESLT